MHDDGDPQEPNVGVAHAMVNAYGGHHKAEQASTAGAQAPLSIYSVDKQIGTHLPDLAENGCPNQAAGSNEPIRLNRLLRIKVDKRFGQPKPPVMVNFTREMGLDIDKDRPDRGQRNALRK